MGSRTVTSSFLLLMMLFASANAKEDAIMVPDLSGFSLSKPLVLLEGVRHQPVYLIVVGRRLVFPFEDVARKFQKVGDRIGEVVYDRSSGAFYAFMNGALVRFEDQKAIVVRDEVLGQDLDVHGKRGLYVVRERDFSIVVYSLSTGEKIRTLAKSESMFRPRFSPDGTKVLVSESRPDHGHFWVFSVEGQGKDMGQGYFPVWLGDSRRVLFCMVKNDSYQITESDLYLIDLDTMERRRLTFTSNIHEITPSVSDDDTFVVFLDAKTWSVMAAPLDLGRLR